MIRRRAPWLLSESDPSTPAARGVFFRYALTADFSRQPSHCREAYLERRRVCIAPDAAQQLVEFAEYGRQAGQDGFERRLFRRLLRPIQQIVDRVELADKHHGDALDAREDRKSTRLNSSHDQIS